MAPPRTDLGHLGGAFLIIQKSSQKNFACGGQLLTKGPPRTDLGHLGGALLEKGNSPDSILKKKHFLDAKITVSGELVSWYATLFM